MDTAVIIAILIAAVGVGWAMSKASKLRKEFPELAERKQPRKSKRQRRLEQIRASEPEFTPPSIEDLVAAEISDAGIDQVEGAGGLPPAVMLKVYRRDEEVAQQCPREKLRFIVADGIEPGEATIDDVALTCDVPLPGDSVGDSSDAG